MKNVTVSGTRTSKISSIKKTTSIQNYFTEPLKSGLLGFIIFMAIFILVKLISYLIGTYELFEIEITDVELSLIGFVLFFLIRFLENFKEREDY
jgi:uncharacterized membrane protein